MSTVELKITRSDATQQTIEGVLRNDSGRTWSDVRFQIASIADTHLIVPSSEYQFHQPVPAGKVKRFRFVADNFSVKSTTHERKQLRPRHRVRQPAHLG